LSSMLLATAFSSKAWKVWAGEKWDATLDMWHAWCDLRALWLRSLLAASSGLDLIGWWRWCAFQLLRAGRTARNCSWPVNITGSKGENEAPTLNHYSSKARKTRYYASR
jgi:hypothetical protein